MLGLRIPGTSTMLQNIIGDFGAVEEVTYPYT